MTSSDLNDAPEWITRGKTVRELIQELGTFEDQGLDVLMSLDHGQTLHRISLVGKHAGACVLFNFEADIA